MGNINDSKVTTIEDFKKWYHLNKNSGLKADAVFLVALDLFDEMTWAGVVKNIDHKPHNEIQTEALNKHNVVGRSELLPLEFIKWYSGMKQEQILKAYERWKIEKRQ